MAPDTWICLPTLSSSPLFGVRSLSLHGLHLKGASESFRKRQKSTEITAMAASIRQRSGKILNFLKGFFAPKTLQVRTFTRTTFGRPLKTKESHPKLNLSAKTAATLHLARLLTSNFYSPGNLWTRIFSFPREQTRSLSSACISPWEPQNFNQSEELKRKQTVAVKLYRSISNPFRSNEISVPRAGSRRSARK